ncbi:MAG: fibronectin type III domain-containing protein, partial [Pirellulales bacterium]|nr:fibronectin type III domain-containing protein [Pirellulales bacterium]
MSNARDLFGGSQQGPDSRSARLFSATRRRRAGFEQLETRLPLAGDLELVKDINQDFYSSTPGLLVDVGGTLYFVAEDGISGQELWKSDGTEAGTVLVKDIWPGTQSSSPFYLTNVGGTLFFSADDGTTARQLWKSDGTEAGTIRVKDLFLGFGPDPSNLTSVGGTLFFTRIDAFNNSSELWKSDGTDAGTVLVKKFLSGLPGASIQHLTDVGGSLFFSANEGVSGDELWKSDGTEAGTILVKDILPGGGSSSPRYLTDVGGTLYFSATDGGSGHELWRSDGTETGTVLVKDIRPGTASSFPSSSFYSGYPLIINVGGTVYFGVTDGVSGAQLWRSDGTEAGTVLVKDLFTGNAFYSTSRSLYDVNGTVFFAAGNSASGFELWKSDGTESGTVQVKDIWPGARSSFGFFGVSFVTKIGATLYFQADDGVSGSELWKSDGTEAGTVRVKDILPGSRKSDPRYLTNLGGTLYFRADDGSSGTELWRSDGTEAGTVRVKDIRPGTLLVPPRDLTDLGGTLYFTASELNSNFELWKSDGTETGTILVNDIYKDYPGGQPRYLTNVAGLLYFTANDRVSGIELWKSNGTVAGTVRVKDIRPGNQNSEPRNLTNVGGILFFTADDGISGRELWRSDGTEAGTVRVKDIRPGIGTGSYGGLSSNPTLLKEVGGKLYFSANDGVSGYELWKSDGTEADTVRVKDIRPGSYLSSSSPSNLTDVNGTLFFIANDGLSGVELWKSDGMEAGTVRVKDIRPGADSAFNPNFPGFLTNFNGTLYFRTNNGISGFDLWKSDGTEAGTVRVADVDPRYITNINGTLFFSGYDNIAGRELWKSDGTEAGTVRVKDIWSGIANAYPISLTNVHGTLYFRANNGLDGTELWKSDGTEAGTVPVRLPGNLPLQSPSAITVAGDRVYVAGTRPDIGTELYSIQLNPAAPSGLTATPTGANKIQLSWTDNATSETGYRVERSTSGPGGPFTTIATLPANATNYTNTQLPSYVNYTYRVVASSAVGDSDPSNTATASTTLELITGTSAADTYRVRRNGSLLEVYENTLPGPGVNPDYVAELAAMTTGVLTFNTLAGNDALVIDANGAADFGALRFVYNAGADENTLQISAGAARVDSTVVGGTLDTTVDAGATLVTAGLRQRDLALAGANSVVRVLPNGSAAGLVVLTRNLSIANGAVLDLNDNDLVLHYDPQAASPLAAITTLVDNFYTFGPLPGSGVPLIASTTVDNSGGTRVIIPVDNANSQFGDVGNPFYDLTLGDSGAGTGFHQVIVRFTYPGDYNLDGQVDGADYIVVDS